MPWVIHRELRTIKCSELKDGDIWYLRNHRDTLILHGPGFRWTHVAYQGDVLVPTTSQMVSRDLRPSYRNTDVVLVLVRYEP